MFVHSHQTTHFYVINDIFAPRFQMDNHEIRPKKFLGVCVSQSNCRLFVGSIPKVKSKDEIFTEFSNLTGKFTKFLLSILTLSNLVFVLLLGSDRSNSHTKTKWGSSRFSCFDLIFIKIAGNTQLNPKVWSLDSCYLLFMLLSLLRS